MRTSYSEDQQAVGDAFGELFAREADSETVRAAAEGCGFDRGLWDKLVSAGAPGMAVPVADGGGGASLFDLAVVVYEWGRRIAPVPLVEHAVTARLLCTPAGRNAPADVREAVVSGELVATLALREVTAGGTAQLVPAGAVAGVVVGIRDDALVLDRSEPPGRARPNTADLPLADRDLSDAEILGGGFVARFGAEKAFEDALTEWKALMAVAYAGLASEVLAMGVAYVKQRHQFGVPVGSFQAVQHGLADAATRAEGARLLAFRAVSVVESGKDGKNGLASMALLFSAESARFASDRVLQYHGGYGYSAEYDVQLYYRRAAAWLLQLGEPATEIAWLADTYLPAAKITWPADTYPPAARRGLVEHPLPARPEAFRVEVKEFLAEHLTAEMIAATRDGTIHSPALHRAIADRGWLSGAVPAELGGGGMDPVELCVLLEELQLHQAPADALGVAVVVVSMILEHGNEHLRRTVAPRMLSGQALACLGYSEPESGSDVAAARTRAERDGDRWVINGSKMWTTLAHVSDYVLLLTRTDPEVPKHRGLTFFVVPLDAEGIEIRPLETMGIERSNATFYDNVVLGDEWRLGEVNGGWDVMKTALKYERGIAGGQFPSPPVIQAAIDWAGTARRAGSTRPIDDERIRDKLVRAMIDVEVCRSFAYHTAALAADGAMFGVEGSMTKLFASESYKKHCAWFLDMMGADALLTHDDPAAHMDGRIEEHFRHAPVTAIYGGTSEINRNLVAEGWLGLPRSR